MITTTFSNRKLSSTEKALINKAARAATSDRFAFCEVGNKSLRWIYTPGDRTTFNDAECIVLGGDLYNSSDNPLASFRLDFTNGLLDIYVYTLDQSLPHADIRRASDHELMTNLTVRIKDGKAIAAWEEGRATEAQMAMYEEAIAEVTGGDE
jgi:hypothetical protein